jgi:transposase InsO family protein
MVEKQSGHHIKVLRSGKGGEYDSNVFHDFFKKHGIKRKFTTRYTPQQNGVAERKEKNIMNMARSMLKENHLSNHFWGEGVACSVYVLNISPTKSVKNKVPQEAWTCMSCNVAQFRVFGCVAYAHVPKELRRKLDEKSEKCIFLRCSD